MSICKDNKISGRVLAFLLIISLLFTMSFFGAVCTKADETAPSSDAETKTLGYFEYIIDTDGVCITGYTGDGGDVSVPNIIEEKSVVAIGDEAFWYCEQLTAIDLPDYLEYIGARAFQGCKSLTGISLPDSVVEISDAAFEGCSSLATVNIPSELIYVGAFAFDNTLWITRFEDNDSIILGGRLFYKYKGSSEMVTIPTGVTGISGNAFASNQTLSYVTIPDTVMFIGDYAFYNCPKLKGASIPDGVYYMGAYSFGYTSVSADGSGNTVDDFVLYVNEGTLGEEYAKAYEIDYKTRAKNPTPDEIPDAETCTAKELEKDSDGNVKGKWFSNKNSVIALIIIVVSCTLIIGGLYTYFAISEKKIRDKKKAEKAEKKAKNKKK